jgi:glycine/D-amino acid oxidase-like deaminating enzyme
MPTGPDATPDYAWTGSFGGTADDLPSIGPVPGMTHCYGVLAFGGNGITFSRIAAEIIRARLTGQDDPEADLFAFR